MSLSLISTPSIAAEVLMQPDGASTTVANALDTYPPEIKALEEVAKGILPGLDPTTLSEPSELIPVAQKFAEIVPPARETAMHLKPLEESKDEIKTELKVKGRYVLDGYVPGLVPVHHYEEQVIEDASPSLQAR